MTILDMSIMGFGKSANRYHLPYIGQRKNIHVKKIYDLEEKPAFKETLENYNSTFTTDKQDILSDESIQLVTLCTPAFTHFELAKECLESGKHVLIEKSFCSSLAEAKELIQLAKDKHLIIMPFQNRRFDGDFLAVKEVVEQGYLGELLEIESHFDYYRPEGKNNAGPFVEGSFYGLGIHTIDQIVSLFGSPEAVSYDIRAIRNPHGTDDYFDVQLFYGRLKAIVKTSHVVLTEYPKFILHGTKGSFIKYGIDQQENDLKAGIFPNHENFGKDSPEKYGKLTYINANGDRIEKQIVTPKGDYGKVYDAIYESIINDAKSLVSEEEMLSTINILEQGFAQPSPSVYKISEVQK